MLVKKDYFHANNLRNMLFKMNTMGDYRDLYLKQMLCYQQMFLKRSLVRAQNITDQILVIILEQN